MIELQRGTNLHSFGKKIRIQVAVEILSCAIFSSLEIIKIKADEDLNSCAFLQRIVLANCNYFKVSTYED
jgi:hypothetical protein